MTCEYCGKYIPNELHECPNCGAANPVYKQLEDEIKDMKRKIADTEKKKAELDKKIAEQRNIQHNAKEAAARQAAENERQIVSDLKLSLKLSFITALLTFWFSDFDTGLILFYIGDVIGNLCLFSFFAGVSKSNIPKIIACAVCCAIACFVLNSSKAYKPDSSSYDSYTTTYNTAISREREKAVAALSSGVPCDGMTLEEVQSLDWGYLKLTKCRDFDHLRVKKRYYEANWYDKNGELIGSGLILYNSNDESDTRLVNFKNRTEKNDQGRE